MTQGINQSRRNLFSRRKTNVLRPPWVKQDIEFTDICTRCDKCIQVCETHIIKRGDGGFPEVDFSIDECTFCQKCSDICPEPVFDKAQDTPWQVKANIKDNCLTHNGIWCQSCKDACDPRAITFTMAVGQVPKPQIDINSCTGCGACVSPCPNDAIGMAAN
ncbi:ferredoxin-type protein NapF [Shewanella gaetbuli]|uniref:Ferredoxin-type protein NapF n=1 Tax=Shewanella gaetbuli TaxID=220752 RepID=A0A9X2CMV1_9GAMM|nr:ferredoxin-type protein NapF [Shewanella gaetbuli]MCL1144034.1 ferredoxin-type protein NapF [Shewanella gaetbuli]